MQLTGSFTAAGLALLAKLSAGGTLQITKVLAGSGATASTASTLSLPQQALTLHPAKITAATATIPADLSMVDAPQAYSLTELGVYAQDPEAGEILFHLYRLDEALAVTPTDRTVLRFYLEQTLSDAMALSITVDPTGCVRESDFEALRARLAAYAPWSPVYVPGDIIAWSNEQAKPSYATTTPQTSGFPYNGNWYCTLCVASQHGWKSLYALDILTSRVFVRSCNYGVWSAWREFSFEDTPPVELALPLAADFSANGACTVIKTKNNLVSIYGECYKRSGSFTDHTVFATLPIGYRPSATTHVSATLQDGGGMGYCAGGVKIFTNGNMEIMTDTMARYCKFSVTFLATQ